MISDLFRFCFVASMDRGTQTGESELDYDIVSIPDSYPDSNDSAAVNHHLALSYDPDEDVRFGPKPTEQRSTSLESRGYGESTAQGSGSQMPIPPIAVDYFVTPTGQCIHKKTCHHFSRKEVRMERITLCSQCLKDGLVSPPLIRFKLDWSKVVHATVECSSFHSRIDGHFVCPKKVLTKCRSCIG